MLNIVRREVRAKHRDKLTECWISRPLDPVLLEYAAFDVIQLRAIYEHYKPTLSRYPHILAESKRYVEMYGERRPRKDSWYFNHGVFPQEILERSAEMRCKFDRLGTKVCGGCERALHQESFQTKFLNWKEGATLCRTCAKVSGLRGVTHIA